MCWLYFHTVRSGRKIPDVTMNLGGAIGCLVAALYLNPVLAAILLCCLPLIGATVGMVTKLMSKSTLEGQGHYGKAGAVANEVRTTTDRRIACDDVIALS
jgi:ABC transporter transmembrane region